jgi:hypothetical protein
MRKKYGAKGKRIFAGKHSASYANNDSKIGQISLIMRPFNDELIPKDTSRAIPGTFYHGILKNNENIFFPKTVISDSGIFITPNYAIYLDQGLRAQCKRIGDFTVEELRMNPEIGALTPMAGEYIIRGSYLKKEGYHLFKDVEGSQVQASPEEEQYIRKRSDVEIEFESGRRNISPDSVSRLECIFAAKSMENIKRMFGRSSRLVILDVEIIEALNCSRVDSRWFEEYFEVQDYAFIENYWSGLQHSDGIDTWEYLIDGAIRVKNQDAAKQALNSNSDACCFEEDTFD